jgi:ribosomal protein S18 acetylase RimI-like enzyme
MEGTAATLALREARIADAHAIAEIHVGAWRAAYRGLVADEYLAALSVEQRRGFWKGQLTKPGAWKVALAQDASGVIGFCSYGPTRDADAEGDAEIFAIYVRPEKWRRGAGRALCEHALREAAAREHRAVSLWVLTTNEAARRFYERLGFAPDGAQKIEPRPLGVALHEVRYRKALA